MMSLEKAIQKAFDRCNLIGDDCDIYSILYQYKAIRDLPDDQIDRIYDQMAEDLGFCR